MQTAKSVMRRSSSHAKSPTGASDRWYSVQCKLDHSSFVSHKLSTRIWNNDMVLEIFSLSSPDRASEAKQKVLTSSDGRRFPNLTFRTGVCARIVIFRGNGLTCLSSQEAASRTKHHEVQTGDWYGSTRSAWWSSTGIREFSQPSSMCLDLSQS